jgi:hypothetical protein
MAVGDGNMTMCHEKRQTILSTRSASLFVGSMTPRLMDGGGSGGSNHAMTNDHSAALILLPTTAELEQILQGLVKNEESIQLAILRQIEQWTHVANACQNVDFFQDLHHLDALECAIDVLQSQIHSPTTVSTTMKLLQTTLPTNNGNDDDHENAAIDNYKPMHDVKKQLAKTLTQDLHGVEVLLQALEIHAMVVSSTKKRSSNSWLCGWSKLLGNHEKSHDDFRTRSVVGQVERDYISIAIGDLDLCCDDDDHDPCTSTTFQDDPVTGNPLEYTSPEAGVQVLQTLSPLVPSMTATQVSNTIKFLCHCSNRLLVPQKWSNCDNNTHMLLIGIVDCLAQAASCNGGLCRFTAKKIVFTATCIMKAFPSASRLNEHCCVLLRQTLPCLEEQDWYDTGVLVVLDRLHNNMNMAMVDAKRLATIVLTDLCEK